ncbi:MAG TPA: GYD domain-containing protein [Acidimicrobiia bacterium]|nr:GYD domain-containing protein [Acidimicrobiia bacterium]
MPTFLIKATYTAEGTRGLLKDGGTGRKEAIEALIESRGGEMKGFYYAFGDDDLYIIATLPANSDLAAVALAINSTAGARVKAHTLLDATEIDEAVQKAVRYRPPGT